MAELKQYYFYYGFEQHSVGMSLSFRLTLFLVSSYTSTVIADNNDSMVCPEALPAASGYLSLVDESVGIQQVE